MRTSEDALEPKDFFSITNKSFFHGKRYINFRFVFFPVTRAPSCSFLIPERRRWHRSGGQEASLSLSQMTAAMLVCSYINSVKLFESESDQSPSSFLGKHSFNSLQRFLRVQRLTGDWLTRWNSFCFGVFAGSKDPPNSLLCCDYFGLHCANLLSPVWFSCVVC